MWEAGWKTLKLRPRTCPLHANCCCFYLDPLPCNVNKTYAFSYVSGLQWKPLFFIRMVPLLSTTTFCNFNWFNFFGQHTEFEVIKEGYYFICNFSIDSRDFLLKFRRICFLLRTIKMYICWYCPKIELVAFACFWETLKVRNNCRSMTDGIWFD